MRECWDFRDSETKPGLVSRILEELCAKCERTVRHEYATRVNAPCINVYVAAFQPAADSSSATTVSPLVKRTNPTVSPVERRRASFITSIGFKMDRRLWTFPCFQLILLVDGLKNEGDFLFCRDCLRKTNIFIFSVCW